MNIFTYSLKQLREYRKNINKIFVYFLKNMSTNINRKYIHVMDIFTFSVEKKEL